MTCDANVHRFRCHDPIGALQTDDLVAFAAADIENSSDGINNYPVLHHRSRPRNTGDGFGRALVDFRGHLQLSPSAPNLERYLRSPSASVPRKYVGILHCGEDHGCNCRSRQEASTPSALQTGEVVYEQEFAASIVAVPTLLRRTKTATPVSLLPLAMPRST